MERKVMIDIGIKVVLAAAVGILFIRQLQFEKSVVYVDAQKLMAGYKGMQVARKEFEAKSDSWRSNLDTLRLEVEAKIKDYEGKKSKLTAQERKLTEELINSKQEQFLNYQQVVKEKVQKEDQELTKKVLDKVNDHIKRYGKNRGYKIIFAATQYGNIVYAEDGVDVTEEILEALNDEFAN